MTIQPDQGEPTTLILGNTWTWRRDDLVTAGFALSDGWAMSYRVTGAAGAYGFSGTNDGNGWLVNVLPSAQNTFVAGQFTLVGFMTLGGDRRQFLSMGLTVNPDPALGSVDLRSHARKVLTNIEAVLEGRATLDQMSYTIDGRRLDRTPLADLMNMRDRYRRDVARETQAEQVSQHKGNRRRVLTRFPGRYQPIVFTGN